MEQSLETGVLGIEFGPIQNVVSFIIAIAMSAR